MILTDCKKQNIEGPAGSQGPNGTNGASAITGVLHGKIILFDSLGKPLSDYSGATVLVEGTDPSISLISQKDGNFKSDAFPSGTYDLSVSKPGFGTMKIYNFQHTGGVNASETGNIELGAIQSSWFDIKTLQVDTTSLNAFPNMSVAIILVHPQLILPGAEVVIYLNHSPGTGNSKNDYAYRTNFYQLNDSTLVISYLDLVPAQFSDNLYKADSVYMAAAIDNAKIFAYTDQAGNIVYPCVGNLSNEVRVFNNLK